MKCVIALVVFVFSMAPPAHAQGSPPVRALDPPAEQALERGLERSAVFRALAASLDTTDLIVHIVTTADLPDGVAGVTRLVTRVGGHRYVRIGLDPSLTPDQRTAILGHELQHACEIAQSPADDEGGVRKLYARIGQRVPGGIEAFDTHAAESAGRRVWEDLHRRAVAEVRSEK